MGHRWDCPTEWEARRQREQAEHALRLTTSRAETAEAALAKAELKAEKYKTDWDCANKVMAAQLHERDAKTARDEAQAACAAMVDALACAEKWIAKERHGEPANTTLQYIRDALGATPAAARELADRVKRLEDFVGTITALREKMDGHYMAAEDIYCLDGALEVIRAAAKDGGNG